MNVGFNPGWACAGAQRPLGDQPNVTVSTDSYDPDEGPGYIKPPRRFPPPKASIRLTQSGSVSDEQQGNARESQSEYASPADGERAMFKVGVQEG